MKKLYLLALPAIVALLAACEKGYEAVDTSDTTADEGSTAVSFNIVSIAQTDFDGTIYETRASSLSDYCTRINLAAFDASGTKTTVNQTSDDTDFGTLSLSLYEGTYDVVIIAHSGTGNATISSVDEIKFANNKVTDTFYYYTQITVDGSSSYDVALARAVAMFRLVVTDATPSDVTQMQFYYTGGSSTFDATTGFGCVNSRQTEVRDVDDTAYDGQSQYEVYTMPHETDDVLKIVVSALDASGETLYERTFTDVPVTINKITQYTGEFFGSSTEQGAATLTLTISDEWSVDEYSY